jgi:LysR family transcriptional regulator for bpeEF and oprC
VAANDGNAYLAAGLAGLGVVMAPRFMIAPHLASGALVPVLSDWTVDPVPLYVVYPPNRHLSTRLRIFVDWVAELLGRELGAAPVP